VAAATPDAVVVASADAGDGTVALLAALDAAGLGGERLWLLRGAVSRYDAAAGALAGATGILTGVSTDPAFAAAVRQEDPGARSLQFAPNAYDAVMLAALAAVLAADDGGASIGFMLPAAGAGGIPCRSFGECLDTLTTQSDIAYQGVSGPLGFTPAGDRESASYVRYAYDGNNAPVVAETLAG
jgi:branched-chain amino acid transport system substrate-binding protein